MTDAVLLRGALVLAVFLFMASLACPRVDAQVTDPCGRAAADTAPDASSLGAMPSLHEQRRAHVLDLTLRIEALEQREHALKREAEFFAYWRMRRTGFWLVGGGFGLALGSGTLLLMSLGTHTTEGPLDTRWGVAAGALFLAGAAVGTTGLVVLGLAPQRHPIVHEVRAVALERRRLGRERRRFDCTRGTVTLQPDVHAGEQRVALVLTLRM